MQVYRMLPVLIAYIPKPIELIMMGKINGQWLNYKSGLDINTQLAIYWR